MKKDEMDYGERLYKFEYHNPYGYKTKRQQIVPIFMLIFLSCVIFGGIFLSDMSYEDRLEFVIIFIPVLVFLTFIIYLLEVTLYFNNLLIFEKGIIPPRDENLSWDLFRRRSFIPFTDVSELKIKWADKYRIREISFNAKGRTSTLRAAEWNIGTITPVLQDGIRYKALRKTSQKSGQPKDVKK